MFFNYKKPSHSHRLEKSFNLRDEEFEGQEMENDLGHVYDSLC